MSDHALTDAELEDTLATLAAELDAAEYRFITLIGEFERRKRWAAHGARSCAHWLSWRCGVQLGAAREKVRVALALPGLPLIAEAFRTAQLSYSKVRALTRIAAPHNEAWLLDFGRTGTAAHVERLVRNARKYGEEAAIAAANRAEKERSLSWRWDPDGSLILSGRLPADVGANFIKAIAAAMEGANRPTHVSAETSEATPEVERYFARRADALGDLAESFLANGYREGAAGERYQVQVIIKDEALQAEASCRCCATADADPTPELEPPARLDDGPPIAVETARRLACDSATHTLTEAPDGQILDIGRRSRAVPPSIARALRRRDGGCRFPGCTCERFVDAHHVIHWADGGPTSLDNLVLLCRTHHRLVHEGGFEVQAEPAGSWAFYRPDGSLIPAAPSPKPVDSEPPEGPIKARNRQDGIEVDHLTARALWRGEAMDDSMALGALAVLKRRSATDASVVV